MGNIAVKQRNDRVVITGMGMVSPLGIGLLPSWQRMLAGESARGPISAFDAAGFPTCVAAEVGSFDPRPFVSDRKLLKYTHKSSTFALGAAQMAFQDSGLAMGQVADDRLGVYIGSGVTGLEAGDFFTAFDLSVQDGQLNFQTYGREGIRRVNPTFLLNSLSNNGLCFISIFMQARGPNNNMVKSGTASGQAIGEGFKVLQRGDADVMIVGGYDSLVTISAFLQYSSVGLLTTRQVCRPFDRRRDGFMPGEGAGILILERLEHAFGRGARVYAEMVGYGCSCDAYHVLNVPPNGEGLQGAMRAALHDAQMAPEEVDYIIAHGNATIQGDRSETAAIKSVLGELAWHVPITSLKPMIGHLGAASDAVELQAGVLAMQAGVVLPTLNYESPDPACDLDYVVNGPRPHSVNAFLCLSRSVGGQNAALAVRRFKDE